MALDLTGKNLLTLKDADYVSYAMLVEIMGDADEIVEDTLTETGSNIPLDRHAPINQSEGYGAPLGSCWRAEVSQTLLVDATNDRVIHDSAQTQANAGCLIDARSANGRLTARCSPHVVSAKTAWVTPRFRWSALDGSGYDVALTDNVLNLYHRTGGVSTSVASIAHTITTDVPVWVTIDLRDNTITIALNGVLKITYVSSVDQHETLIGLGLYWTSGMSAADVAGAYCDYFRFDPSWRMADRSYDLVGVEGVVDTFVEGSDTALASHTPNQRLYSEVWIADSGSSLLKVKASTDQVFWDGAANQGFGHTIPGVLDGYVQADITPYTDGATELAVIGLRIRHTGTTGLFVMFDAIGGTVLFMEQTARTAFTILTFASLGTVIASGEARNIRVSFVGPAINIWVAGVLLITTTSSVNATTAACGLGLYVAGSPSSGNTGLARVDNFTYGPVIHYDNLVGVNGLTGLELQGQEGGGLAALAQAALTIPNQGQFSNRAEASAYFSGKSARVYVQGVTGYETTLDRVRRFTGSVLTIPYAETDMQFTLEPSMDSHLTAFPRDVVNLGVYPNASLGEIGKPVPWVFGNFTGNIRPTEAVAGDVPSFDYVEPVLLDIFTKRYAIHGSNNLPTSTYGPLFYDKSKNQSISADPVASWALGADGNRGVSLTASTRILLIDVIRAGAGNTFAEWKNVADGDGDTWVGISQNADLLVLSMAGSQNRGTISAVEVRVTTELGSGSGTSTYNVKKAGVSKTSGLVSTGSPAQHILALTASDWTDWAFDTMTIEFAQTGTKAYNVYSVYVNVTYSGQESLSQGELPLFLQVAGYEDTASRYADGAVIDVGGVVIRNPPEQLEAILRDRTNGINTLIRNINTTKFDLAATALTDYYFDFVIAQLYNDFSAVRSWLDAFAKQAHLALWLDYNDQWVVDVFDPTEPCVWIATINRNIGVTNPLALPSEQQDTFKVLEPGAFYNEFFIRYGWSAPLQTFTKFTAASGRYLCSGVNGSTGSGGTEKTLTSIGATFQTKNVQVGYKVYARSGDMTVGVYTIDAITSETVLTVSTSMGASKTGIEYYIGPYLDATCVESFLAYGVLSSYPADQSDWPLIQDDATAAAVLAAKVDYFATKKEVVQFQADLGALHLEYRDLIYVDHGFLQPTKQKTDVGGVLTSTITATATSIAITGTLPAVNDVILIGSEGMLVTGNGASPITVTRGYAGSVAVAHNASTTIYVITTKWEVLRVGLDPNNSNPFTVTAREV